MLTTLALVLLAVASAWLPEALTVTLEA